LKIVVVVVAAKVNKTFGGVNPLEFCFTKGFFFHGFTGIMSTILIPKKKQKKKKRKKEFTPVFQKKKRELG